MYYSKIVCVFLAHVLIQKAVIFFSVCFLTCAFMFITTLPLKLVWKQNPKVNPHQTSSLLEHLCQMKSKKFFKGIFTLCILYILLLTYEFP